MPKRPDMKHGHGIDEYATYGKTASLLCNRNYTSTLFVQNISRWSVAPGALIAHLLKQELVRRSPALRTALLRHPNAPSAEKQR